MMLLKIAPVLLLSLLVRADKKIELQDIEEDNLKSEKQNDVHTTDSQTIHSSPGALDFFKNGLLRYFENQQGLQAQQQPRYVQQYAVTEPPEPPVAPKPQYATGPAQQAMVGYLSNVPMQIYLVPQYYNEPSEQASNTNPGLQYSPTAPRASYTAPEAVQPQTNYIEVPAYVTPTGKAYISPQYSQPPATYFTYTPQPTVSTANSHQQHMFITAPAASSTVGHPQVLYQMPYTHAQYSTSIVSPPVYQKQYYTNSQISDLNTNEEERENEIESPNEYAAQTEAPTYTKSPERPRYYHSRAPIREEHSSGHVEELPHPSPLLLRPHPPHLAHLPKALPQYRPLTKQIYANVGGIISNSIAPRPSDAYGAPFRKRPSSLLDSYIPSGVQLEYIKRGYGKDPLAVYDALSSGRHFHHPVTPRHYERGFLPNQMYHTASGGVTFGHYKRTPKPDSYPQSKSR